MGIDKITDPPAFQGGRFIYLGQAGVCLPCHQDSGWGSDYRREAVCYGAAEDYLFSLGFTDFRVRSQEGRARLQLHKAQLGRLLEHRQDILMLVEWKAQEQIVFTANEDYYGGVPAISHVTVVFMSEDAALAAVQAGEADVAYSSATLGRTEVDGYHVEAFGIQRAWLGRFPGELSGGELLRFCVARALMSGADYLVCDEISTMLDVITQSQIWRVVLDEARKRHMGVIAVTHNRHLAGRIATRVVELSGQK